MNLKEFNPKRGMRLHPSRPSLFTGLDSVSSFTYVSPLHLEIIKEKPNVSGSKIFYCSHFQCPPKVPNSRCTCEIKCQNEAMFIAGR